MKTCFSGSRLDRNVSRPLEDIIDSSEFRVVLVSQRSVVTVARKVDGSSQSSCILSKDDLRGVLGMEWACDGRLVRVGQDLTAVDDTVCLLGRDGETEEYILAIDIASSVMKDGESSDDGGEWLWVELRAFAVDGNEAEVAIAGQAVALLQWHRCHMYCPTCGAPTVSANGGKKRLCTGNDGHRLYPRTDPVVIMLVESFDGTKVLLGRSKKMPPGMMTCLSGFVDQGESISDAVKREVKEEAGIDVDDVVVVGSQPWPLGRGGSHELMIGCVAKAINDKEITIDPVEMDVCTWVDVPTLQQAVRVHHHHHRAAPNNAAPTSTHHPMIPPPLAIAHQLIVHWLAHTCTKSNM